MVITFLFVVKYVREYFGFGDPHDPRNQGKSLHGCDFRHQIHRLCVPAEHGALALFENLFRDLFRHLGGRHRHEIEGAVFGVFIVSEQVRLGRAGVENADIAFPVFL